MTDRARRREELLPLVPVAVGLVVFVRAGLIDGPAIATVVALTGLVGVLAGALIAPRAGLAGVVAALPFYRFGSTLGGQSFGVVEAALLVTALAVGLRAANGRFRLVRVAGRAGPAPAGDPAGAPTPGAAWASFDGPIILLLVAALLSLLATEYLRLSLRELRTLVVEPVLFWYLCRAALRGPRDAALLIATLVGVASVVALLALTLAAAGVAVTDVQGVRRILGPYTSPNHLALLLGRALPFLVALAWLLPRWRIAAGGGALLCAAALLATFSVGGWLATGLALLAVAGLLGGRRALLVLALTGAVAGAIVLVAAPVERLAGRLDPRQGTSLMRIQLWQAAVALGGASPVLGIGLDNFLYRYPATIPAGTPYEPNLSHPHNLVLQFWLQLGLGGPAALAWLLWCFGRLAWPAARGPASGGGAAAAPAVDPAPTPGTPPDRGAAEPDALRRGLAVGALGSMVDFVAHGLVDNSYFLPDMAIVFWLALAAVAVLGPPRR